MVGVISIEEEQSQSREKLSSITNNTLSERGDLITQRWELVSDLTYLCGKSFLFFGGICKKFLISEVIK